MNIENIIGHTFISGPHAMTDIHNGGTIVGIIYYTSFEFSVPNKIKVTNKVTFNRGMNVWQESKEKEIWTGFYKIDINHKHLECKIEFQNLKKLYT
jgi:hypothetical protein